MIKKTILLLLSMALLGSIEASADPLSQMGYWSKSEKSAHRKLEGAGLDKKIEIRDSTKKKINRLLNKVDQSSAVKKQIKKSKRNYHTIISNPALFKKKKSTLIQSEKTKRELKKLKSSIYNSTSGNFTNKKLVNKAPKVKKIINKNAKRAVRQKRQIRKAR